MKISLKNIFQFRKNNIFHANLKKEILIKYDQTINQEF